MTEWTDTDKALLKLANYLYPTYKEEAIDLAQWHQDNNTHLAARADLAVQIENLQAELVEALSPTFIPIVQFILNTHERYRRWKDT